MSRQLPLPLPHSEAMAADDFVITASNREATHWVNAWPAWSSHGLLVLGPSGSGKTHLLNLWRQRSQAILIAVADLPAFDIHQHTTIAIDNVDTIAGNSAAEEALFHLHNHLRDTKGYLLLTATLPPAQWVAGLPDLRSRLLALPTASIGAPDDDLLTMLLVKQFRDRQIEIGAEVITYLVPRIERSTAALRDLVTRLDQASLAEGRGVTVALARKVLEMRDLAPSLEPLASNLPFP